MGRVLLAGEEPDEGGPSQVGGPGPRGHSPRAWNVIPPSTTTCGTCRLTAGRGSSILPGSDPQKRLRRGRHSPHAPPGRCVTKTALLGHREAVAQVEALVPLAARLEIRRGCFPIGSIEDD